MTTFTMDDILAIVKPHHDKIIAEGKAERLEKQNAELLDALRSLTDSYEKFHGWTPKVQRARAVIAKAEGRS